MGIFYLVLVILLVLAFIVNFFAVSDKLKLYARVFIILCLIAAILYEAIM